jgi:transcriptional regulator with XRE-family HTH domain
MGYKIKDLRIARNMSQEELAEKSGVSRTIISFLETGKDVETKTGTLQKIAKALDVSLAFLFQENV